MRKCWMLLLLLMCTGCSALPAEERSFVVAMGVENSGNVWEVSARMPTYQTGGGYMTLSARGTSLEEAIALLDATSPMQLHLGQMRLVVLHQGIAESADFRNTLNHLSRWQDFRLQAIVCVTGDNVKELMDKLEPATGSRLSKSLDVLLEARREQGVISAMTLSDIQRLGERQSPVLTSAALEDSSDVAQPGMDAAAGGLSASGAGKVQFGGGWLVDTAGSAKGELTAGEMQFLSILSGKLRKGLISLEEGTVTMMDSGSRISLGGNLVSCFVTLHYTYSTLTEAGVEQAVKKAFEGVAAKLAAAGCDALGIGRKAILHFSDMGKWRLLDWLDLYPQLEWEFTVSAEPAA